MYGQKRTTPNTGRRRSVTDNLALAMAGLYALLCEVKPEQWEGLQAAMRQAGVKPHDPPGLWPERAEAVRRTLLAMPPGRVVDLAMAVARKIERHACER